jgi:hypothetical protein
MKVVSPFVIPVRANLPEQGGLLPPANLPEGSKGEAREKAAEVVNVSPHKAFVFYGKFLFVRVQTSARMPRGVGQFRALEPRQRQHTHTIIATFLSSQPRLITREPSANAAPQGRAGRSPVHLALCRGGALAVGGIVAYRRAARSALHNPCCRRVIGAAGHRSY